MRLNTLKNNISESGGPNSGRIDGDSSGKRFSNPLTLILPLFFVLIIFFAQYLLSFTLFRNDDAAIARDFPYTSLESPILQSAVREINAHRQEIDLKDIQIRRYQNRILDQDQKLTLLQGLMEDALKVKESDLLIEIDAIVGEERIRLKSLGRSEEQINQSIDKLKADLDTQYTEKLDAFRSSEMVVYEQRIVVLREERESLEEALNYAVEERKDMVETLEVDQSELLAQLYEDGAFIDIVNAGVDADLEILKESRKVENYWLDELANNYLGLIEAISERDYERAESHVATLESLFETTAVSELAGIEARNEADRELIRFFSAYLKSTNQNEISTLIAETNLLTDQAFNYIRSARYQEAEIAWRKISGIWPMIDQIMSGYTHTRDILVADDLREYASIAEASLLQGEYDKGFETWSIGLDQIPDPLGTELADFWIISNSAQSDRIEELSQLFYNVIAIEKEEASLVLESLKGNKEIQPVESDLSGDNNNQELLKRIESQDAELTDLRARVARAESNRVSDTTLSREEEDSVSRELLVAAELGIQKLEQDVVDLVKRTDLEEETIVEVIRILREEFEE